MMETKKPSQLQTKLYHVEDTLVSFGPLQLTLRQSFVLVLGGCGTLRIWHDLSGLIPSVMLLVLSCVPLVLSALVAGVRVADRYAEAWLSVLLAYLYGYRVYLWRPFDRPKKKQHLDEENREDEDHAE